VIDAEPLIDDEVLVFQLLFRDLTAQTEIPNVTVSASVDVDEQEGITLPFVSFSIGGDGQLSNGAGLWSSVLDVSCIANGMDAAKALARLVYRIVHAWSIPGNATVPEIGGIVDVGDVSKFTRQPAARLDDSLLVEYDGSFAIQLQN
jgi:hypothetical protein